MNIKELIQYIQSANINFIFFNEAQVTIVKNRCCLIVFPLVSFP